MLDFKIKLILNSCVSEKCEIVCKRRGFCYEVFEGLCGRFGYIWSCA